MKVGSSASILFFILAILCTPNANAQAAPEKSKIICDHAAPPRGMHWVCKSQCDCHLEGKLKNDEDGLAPVGKESANSSTDPCQAVVALAFAPEYPAIARANRMTGRVLIRVEIDMEGNVQEASLEKGHPQLAEAAIKAVRRWRFSPHCIKVQTVSVSFDLTEDKDTNPPGFEFQAPFDLRVVATAPTIHILTTRVVKNKTKKIQTSPPASK
jgi:TonB family protein